MARARLRQSVHGGSVRRRQTLCSGSFVRRLPSPSRACARMLAPAAAGRWGRCGLSSLRARASAASAR